jgi:hypothetical protein
MSRYRTPIPTIDFPIHRFQPRLIDLRLYTYQMASDTFGLSDDLCDLIREKCGEVSVEAIDALDREGLHEVLEDRMPDTLFVFSTQASEQHPLLRDLEPEHSLVDLLGRAGSNEGIPILYTGINQVSFDSNGIVVMISYLDQIYTLCRRDGKPLTGRCHDLEIGVDGHILSRSSSDPVWQQHVFDGLSMQLVEEQGMPMWDRSFPGLGYRELIPQMFEDSAEFKAAYPLLDPKGSAGVADFLRDNDQAWRVLGEWYRDEPALAVEAVKADRLAYTYLSANLKADLAFNISMLHRLDEPGRIYPYLTPEIRKDRQVVMICYPECPEALEHLGVIDDRQILRNVFKKGWGFEKEKYLSLAADPIRSDRAFVLELAVHTYWVIFHTTPENYTDLAFVEQVVATYLEAEDAKSAEWDLDLPF